MKAKIVTYFAAAKKHRNLSIWFDNTKSLAIEQRYSNSNNIHQEIHICGYDKHKKIIFDGHYNLSTVKNISFKIKKCSLVIMQFHWTTRMAAINLVKQYSHQEHCFAPIVFTDQNELLFFPKLRFQDCFFLDSLLNSSFKNRIYHIIFAGNHDLVTII